MAATSLRFEDRLDGASNFLSWKARVSLLLKEHDLWEIVEKVVPTPTNAAKKATLEKDIKAQRVILDAEGSFDPSRGREAVGQRDVQGSSGFVPE
jgi:hypothetical protein